MLALSTPVEAANTWCKGTKILAHGGTKPTNWCKAFLSPGNRKERSPGVMCGRTPSALTVWLKNLTSGRPNTHFKKWINDLVMLGQSHKKCSEVTKRSSGEALKTRMSKVKSRPWSTVSINHWKIWATFLNLNGVRQNLYKQKGVMSAVLVMLSLCTHGLGSEGMREQDHSKVLYVWNCIAFRGYRSFNSL